MKEKPEVKCLFSTPVYESIINIDSKSLKTLLETKLEFMKHVNNGYMSKEKFVLDNKKLKSLKNKIQKHAENYFHTVLEINEESKLYIKNSWVTKHSKGDYTQPHYHANSVLTAILYLKNTEGAGKLHLHRPETFTFLPAGLQFKHKSYNMINAVTYALDPFDSLLVIMPSHLKHSSGINETNLDRYLVSCDFFVKGKIGLGDMALKL